MKKILLALLFVSSNLYAQANPNALDVEADSLNVNTQSGSATFSGNVILEHTGLTLKTKQLALSSTDGKVTSATATGNVKILFQGGEATGNTAIWRPAADTVTLKGNVTLTQNGNTLTGETLTYTLKTRSARLSSGNSGRVKAVFTPNK